MTHKFLQLAHKLIKLTFGVGGQNSSSLKVVRAAKGIEIKIMTKNKCLFSTYEFYCDEKKVALSFAVSEEIKANQLFMSDQ